MIGTTPRPVTRSVSIRRKISAASNLCSITCFPPNCVTKCAAPQPLAWKRGMVCRWTMSIDGLKLRQV